MNSWMLMGDGLELAVSAQNRFKIDGQLSGFSRGLPGKILKAWCAAIVGARPTPEVQHLGLNIYESSETGPMRVRRKNSTCVTKVCKVM